MEKLQANSQTNGGGEILRTMLIFGVAHPFGADEAFRNLWTNFAIRAKLG